MEIELDSKSSKSCSPEEGVEFDEGSPSEENQIELHKIDEIQKEKEEFAHDLKIHQDQV